MLGIRYVKCTKVHFLVLEEGSLFVLPVLFLHDMLYSTVLMLTLVIFNAYYLYVYDVPGYYICKSIAL